MKVSFLLKLGAGKADGWPIFITWATCMGLVEVKKFQALLGKRILAGV